MARIGIDARIFGTRKGGIGRYVEELALALPAYDKRNTFVLFMRKNDMRLFKSRSSRVKKVCADIREYSGAEQTHMPSIIEGAKIDLLHVPHINVPYAYRGPLIVTVHDLIEYKYDRANASTFPKIIYRGKRAALRATLPRTLSRANALIAVSLWGKNDIQKTLPRVKTPITIIPHGAPRLSKKKSSAPLSVPYVVYVGSAAPHKNVLRLIMSFTECVKRNTISEHLVLVLPQDMHTENLHREAMRHLSPHVRERIHVVSNVSDEELASYIRHANLLCSSSLEEGYGLPFVEALALGTPVLASFVGILPEVAGVYASYWDPTHITSMARRLTETLHGPAPRVQSAISLPPWRNVAQRHISLYTSVLKGDA